MKEGLTKRSLKSFAGNQQVSNPVRQRLTNGWNRVLHRQLRGWHEAYTGSGEAVRESFEILFIVGAFAVSPNGSSNGHPLWSGCFVPTGV